MKATITLRIIFFLIFFLVGSFSLSAFPMEGIKEDKKPQQNINERRQNTESTKNEIQPARENQILARDKTLDTVTFSTSEEETTNPKNIKTGIEQADSILEELISCLIEKLNIKNRSRSASADTLIENNLNLVSNTRLQKLEDSNDHLSDSTEAYDHFLKKPNTTEKIWKNWEDVPIEIQENAESYRKEVDKITTQTKKLIEDLETAVEEKRYYDTFYFSKEAIQASQRLAMLWSQVSEVYSFLPGRHWGLINKTKWNKRIDVYLDHNRSAIKSLIDDAHIISSKTAAIIDQVSGGYRKLDSEKRNTDASQLSEIWEKLIAAKKALDLGCISIKTSAPSPVAYEHFYNRDILALDLAVETAKKNIQEAISFRERIAKGLIEKQSDQPKSQSSSLVFSKKVSSNEVEIVNEQFQQHAEAVLAYAAKTDEVIYDVFSYFTMDGELGDQTDLTDLSNACDALEGAIAILAMVREKTENSPLDVFSKEKQSFSIENVEQATNQVHIIAQRIKEYPQDRLTREILKNLLEIEKEYENHKNSIG